MTIQADIFGDDVPATAVRTKYPERCPWKQPAGYADVPGTGPAGTTCGDCARHYEKRWKGKRYHKCKLSPRQNLPGVEGDIKLSSPSCREFLVFHEMPQGKVAARRKKPTVWRSGRFRGGDP